MKNSKQRLKRKKKRRGAGDSTEAEKRCAKIGEDIGRLKKWLFPN
jgi:hypothetical protein